MLNTWGGDERGHKEREATTTRQQASGGEQRAAERKGGSGRACCVCVRVCVARARFVRGVMRDARGASSSREYACGGASCGARAGAHLYIRPVVVQREELGGSERERREGREWAATGSYARVTQSAVRERDARGHARGVRRHGCVLMWCELWDTRGEGANGHTRATRRAVRERRASGHASGHAKGAPIQAYDWCEPRDESAAYTVRCSARVQGSASTRGERGDWACARFTRGRAVRRGRSTEAS